MLASYRWIALTVALGLWGGAPAAGAVMFTSTAHSEFHIRGATVVLGAPFGGVFDVGGTGVAGYSGSATISGVLPAVKDMVIGGSAFAPPNSFATATFMAGHIFEIDNTGGPGPDTSLLTVPFEFAYSWDIDVARDFPGLEFASAGAFFHITGIDTEALFVDGLGVVPEYLHHVEETTLFGGTGSSGFVVVTGAILVPAESVSVFSVITDASGLAIAQTVPEPGTIAIWSLMAIVGGGWHGRRRRWCRLSTDRRD